MALKATIYAVVNVADPGSQTGFWRALTLARALLFLVERTDAAPAGMDKNMLMNGCSLHAPARKMSRGLAAQTIIWHRSWIELNAG